MPKKRCTSNGKKGCTSNGKKGWKYGDSGKCYTGPDAKEKADKQGRAIRGSQGKK